MKIVSKIVKLLNFVFLVVVFIHNCSAVNTLIYVPNNKIYSTISSYLNISRVMDEYFSTKDIMLCKIKLENMTFAVNNNDFKKVIVSTPVYSSVRGIVGEVIIPIEFENVDTIDDVLKAMTSDSKVISKFKLGDVKYKHFWTSYKKLDKYLEKDYLSSFIKNNCDAEEDSVVYYEYSPNCIFFKNSFDIDNIKLVCRSSRGLAKFTFKEPGVLKSANLTANVSLLDNISRYSPKKEGYKKLPINGAEFVKLKVD